MGPFIQRHRDDEPEVEYIAPVNNVVPTRQHSGLRFNEAGQIECICGWYTYYSRNTHRRQAFQQLHHHCRPERHPEPDVPAMWNGSGWLEHWANITDGRLICECCGWVSDREWRELSNLDVTTEWDAHITP